MKIFIAGAGGQLGRWLQVALKGHELRALPHKGLDIGDFPQVQQALKSFEPDLVINAAAYNDVDGAESDPESAFRVNAVGARNLATCAAAVGSRVLHFSTDYVFDGTSVRPYHEYDEPHPISVYGKSKYAGERAVAGLNPRHYIVRTAWLYHEHGRNFPNTILDQSLKGDVRVVNDQIGSPTYVPHLSDAIRQLIETDAYGIYHLAGRGGASWYDLTRALFRELGITSLVTPVSTADFPRPAQRPRYSVLATIQEPRILLPSWKQGMKEFAAAVNATQQRTSGA
jgi:dTDP-4-dehydrorhamnose reductase